MRTLWQTCIGVASVVLWAACGSRTGMHQQPTDNRGGSTPGDSASPCGSPRCDAAAADDHCTTVSGDPDARCECDPRATATSACNEHPGHDGLGPCRAGTRQCSAGHWGPCSGDVGPSLEACGPAAPDTNCTGIAGDGVGCLSTLRIYGRVKAAECNSEEGDFRNHYGYDEGQMKAAQVSPGREWVEISSFNVFTNPGPGLVAVRNCRASRYVSWDAYQYVMVGDSCSTIEDALELEDLSVAGYVSKQTAPGYRTLSQVMVRYSYYGSMGDVPIAQVPVSSCPRKCACSSSSFYVVP